MKPPSNRVRVKLDFTLRFDHDVTGAPFGLDDEIVGLIELFSYPNARIEDGGIQIRIARAPRKAVPR